MADSLVLVEELLTIVCGGFNASYFLAYCLARTPALESPGYDALPARRQSRRLGSAALILLNAAIVVESLFSLALYWSHHWHGPIGLVLAPPVWLSVRALLLVATAFISALVLRQLSQR